MPAWLYCRIVCTPFLRSDRNGALVNDNAILSEHFGDLAKRQMTCAGVVIQTIITVFTVYMIISTSLKRRGTKARVGKTALAELLLRLAANKTMLEENH
jgi:hypothetical protein